VNYKYLLGTLFLGLLVVVAVPLIGAEDTPKATDEAAKAKFANDAEKFSYTIGARTGQQLKQLADMGMEVSLEEYIHGVRDAMEGKDLALTDEAMQEVMKSFQQEMMAKQQAKREKEGKENLTAGKDFLEANGKKDGVKVLPSGLQYKVLKEGTGDSPSLNDKVKAHYEGTLVDGTVFDSSYKRGEPATFALRGVIRGWTEALQLMQTGAKWQLFIPADLAYGDRGSPPKIGSNATLIFEVELLEVIKGKPGKAGGNSIQITPPTKK